MPLLGLLGPTDVGHRATPTRRGVGRGAPAPPPWCRRFFVLLFLVLGSLPPPVEGPSPWRRFGRLRLFLLPLFLLFLSAERGLDPLTAECVV
ncbi:MAG TPA: hypothetical protein VEJ85_00585, partial [Thermoplasmata archaeon]|nr:hypothetical protein [Thermoplasmata archaeon]